MIEFIIQLLGKVLASVISALGAEWLVSTYNALPIFWIIVGGCFLFLLCVELFL